MDNNIYTLAFVTCGAIIQQILKQRADQKKDERADERARHDAEDRKDKNELVLAAVKENTVVSTVASEAAVAVNEKLAAVVPGTETDRALANMLNVDAISPGDIARVLIDIKKTVDVLEDYAHKSVHRLNNLLATLQKPPDAPAK